MREIEKHLAYDCIEGTDPLSLNLFPLDALMNINQMYQYSLSWFVGHLTAAIDNTDKVDDVQQRIKDLKKFFTYFIYTKLCRSLQEKVKIH